MRFAGQHFPGVPQVACFDTAFHVGMPEVARTLPIPLELRAEGVERYGFHGLSCESIVRQLAKPPAATRSRAESIPSIPSIFI
jgi:acetate kinase